MNTKHHQLQTRRLTHSAAKTICLLSAALIFCGLAVSEARGQEVSVRISTDFYGGSAPGVRVTIGPRSVTTDNKGLALVDIPLGTYQAKVDGPCPVTRVVVSTNIVKTGPDSAPTLAFQVAQYQGGYAVSFLMSCNATPPASGTSPPPDQSRLPIIFLAGVAGSELKSLKRPEHDNVDCIRERNCPGVYVWPKSPTQERAKLGLKEDGQTPSLSPLDYRITVAKILDSSAPEVGYVDPLNFYGSMMFYLLATKGYDLRSFEGTHIKRPITLALTPNVPNLFAFPYDWRLDNATHFTALDNVIDDALKQNPNAKKVILLTHSMGGLIARAYILSSPARAAKVDSLITMGAPYWGAPKPYYGVVSGYQFGNPTVNQNLMKILSQNFPAAYQLMPNYPFIKDTNANDQRLTLKESSRIKYKGFTDVTPTINIFKDKYEETADNIWSFNAGLVKLAEDFNRPFGSRDNPTPLPESVKHYVIIGTGVKTLMFFRMRDFRIPERFVELDGRKVVLEPIFGNGDGTVPLHGSRIRTATRTYYIPYVETWGPDNSSGHGDLPANTTVQKIVGDIIDGNPPASSKEEPPADFTGGEVDLEKGVDFTLHSDAHLSITDQSTGRKLGFNDQGGINEDLPSGTFLSMEGVEYASIADINRTLKVTVTGIQTGKFTLDVSVKRPGGATTPFSYQEVSVKKGTVAQVTLTPSQVPPIPAMSVTTDGNTTMVPATIGPNASPAESGPTVKTKKPVYAPNERIEVEYSNPAGLERDWIAIARPGEGEQGLGLDDRWSYIGKERSATKTFGGLAEGQYEARYISWDNGNNRATARSSFTVGNAPTSSTTGNNLPVTSGSGDLSGLWIDDTRGGGIYRLRQIGNKVYWGVDAVSRGSFANVYQGEIAGATINGEWVDVPGSPTLSGGKLVLRIESNCKLSKMSSSNHYGAQVWIRQGSTCDVVGIVQKVIPSGAEKPKVEEIPPDVVVTSQPPTRSRPADTTAARDKTRKDQPKVEEIPPDVVVTSQPPTRRRPADPNTTSTGDRNQPTTQRQPPTQRQPVGERWTLVSVSASPETPPQGGGVTWNYNAQSSSAQYALYNGDKASFQWTPPPQQIDSSGFTVSVGVQSNPAPRSRLAATINVSGSGLNTDTPRDQQSANAHGENGSSASDQKSVMFTPIANSSELEVRISFQWAITYTYKYRRVQ